MIMGLGVLRGTGGSCHKGPFKKVARHKLLPLPRGLHAALKPQNRTLNPRLKRPKPLRCDFVQL